MGEFDISHISQSEHKEAETDVYWQKANAALTELRNVNNLDKAHIAFVAKMHDAFQAKDAETFTALVVNEWARFQGSHHARFYETPSTEEFLVHVATLEKFGPTD